MDTKPLMFISTPNTISNNNRNQYDFDSRVGVIDERIKVKLMNMIKLNNKGRSITCKVFLEKENFTCIPKVIENDYLVYDSLKIHLTRIKDVEILQL